MGVAALSLYPENVANQWFVEPKWATRLLLEWESFDGTVYDPACGQGNIVEVFSDAGFEAFGSDIVERKGQHESWFLGAHDFINQNEDYDCDNIVSNPPYYLARGTEAYIRKALTVARDTVAIFAPIGFLAGGKRSGGLYQETPPHRIHIISPRPSCPPGQFLVDGGTAENGTTDYMWMIWSVGLRCVGTEIIWHKPNVVREVATHTEPLKWTRPNLKEKANG
jgi:hypothetical protein